MDFAKSREATVPFTDRISTILQSAIYNSGGTVSTVKTGKGASVDDAIKAMIAVPFDRGLIVNVRDSRVDAGGIRWSYFYDYEVIVVDQSGAVISKKNYSGEDTDFQREIFHSGREKGKSYSFQAVLDIEYKNKFSEFLDDRDTRFALARSAGNNLDAGGMANDKDGAKRLASLKEMLDKGLISQDDYEKKKAEILKSL